MVSVRRTLGLLSLTVWAACAPAGSTAQTLTYRTSDDEILAGVENQGWWRSDGFHQPANSNYLVGSLSQASYRDFFSFRLTGLPANVTSATLHLQTFQIVAPGTFQLFDVSALPGQLVGGPNDLSVFQDLGTGTSYGAFDLDPAQADGSIDVVLNEAAIADIRASGGEWFSIGGSFVPASVTANGPRSPSGGGLAGAAPTGYAFGYSGSSGGANRLILYSRGPTAVPVSGSATTLIGVALAGLAFLRRARSTGGE